MDADAAVKQLSGIRLGVGLGAWRTPRLAGNAFLLSVDDNPQSPYLARLFGAARVQRQQPGSDHRRRAHRGGA